MERVTGIGGIFFKARDTKQLGQWYADHLGVPIEDWGGTAFEWREKDDPERVGQTVFSLFKGDTKYFDPSDEPFMVNFRVKDLDAMLAQLREQGCTVDDKIEDSEFGRFGWVMDPEGHRIELWQPPS